MPNQVIYIMGVSGSGKTTIGELLSAKTGYQFYDADNFHPQHNIEKMSAGQPLTDDDRWPWLDEIHDFVARKLITETIIIACSALKDMYRKRLSDGIEDHCCWVFLNGNFDTIRNRLHTRAGHFMPENLLQSQFDALEYPAGAIQIDISLAPEIIVEQIIAALK